jgi:pyridoxine 5-phosphate synthase
VYYQGRFHLLCVNLDGVTAPKRTPGEVHLDPVEAALACADRGCDGISLHVRHGRSALGEEALLAVRGRIQGALNLVVDLSGESLSLATRVRPHKIIVDAEELLQAQRSGQFDQHAPVGRVRDHVAAFHAHNALVALCIEPDPEMIGFAKECGADFVEIHTGSYGRAAAQEGAQKEFSRIYAAAKRSVQNRLKVSAGHVLGVLNIDPVLRARALEEVHIGEALRASSRTVGLAKAVKELRELLD